MELLLLLEGSFSAKSKVSCQAWEGTYRNCMGKKAPAKIRAWNILEKEIVSHIHLLINFYERLSSALNPRQFITKKGLDAQGWDHELTPTPVMN